MTRSNTVVIDLHGVRDKEDLLERIGEVLELGGPEGNHPTRPDSINSGWGMNWDALADSLDFLESGGIWNTSVALPFPLHLKFTNARELQLRHPEALRTLVDILEETKAGYARRGKAFEYSFEQE